MARQKPPAKPFFSVKHDFVASLDNLSQQAIMLLQSVKFVLDHGDLPKPIKEALQERHDAFRAALISDDEDAA